MYYYVAFYLAFPRAGLVSIISAMNRTGSTPQWAGESGFNAVSASVVDGRVREALEFMASRLREPLSVHAIACHLGVSDSHFERLFRARNRESPDGCTQTGPNAPGRVPVTEHGAQCQSSSMGGRRRGSQPFHERLQETPRRYTAGLSEAAGARSHKRIGPARSPSRRRFPLSAVRESANK